MSDHIANSESSLQDVLGVIRELYRVHKYVKIKVTTGKARSLDQNAIMHAWIEQVARELREEDALGWKRFVKLTMGIPILRADDEEFRAKYDKTLRHIRYEEKLEIMDWFPVTSLMTKEQLSKLLEKMQEEFSKRGVLLEFPEVQA